jgi:hypothetical protein
MKNPSAFPSKIQAPFGVQIPQPGMTLRDYFAAAALPGIIAKLNENELPSFNETAAECAYDVADAMLEYRDRIK